MVAQVPKRDSIPLSICIGASLAIHALVLLPWVGAAMGIGPASIADSQSPEAVKPEAKPPDPADERPNPLMRRPTEMERTQLGIDDGTDKPLTTWIGYDEYQEHLARLSEIEQAAMRMTEAGGGEPASAPPGAMSLASPLTPPLPEEAPPSPVTAVDRTADRGQLADARPAAPELAPDRTANAPPTALRAIESAPLTRAAPTSPVPSPPIEAARPVSTPPLEPAKTQPPPPTSITETPNPSAATTPPPPSGLTLPRSDDPTSTSEGAPLPPKSAPGEAPKIEPIVRPVDGSAKSPPPSETRPTDDAPTPAQQPKPDAPPNAPVPGARPDSTSDATRPPESAVAPAIAPTKPDPSPAAPTPEIKPVPAPQDETTAPPHPDPDRAAPPSPPARPEATPIPADAPGAPSRAAGTPGPPVDGELTDREADATSTIDVPADKWRNGKPLAARGLQILTRRPEMLPEYLAIQMGPGRNPVFELQFDREGRVRKVTMTESSGAPQLDDRLIDCLYKWRARGERLNQVKPNDRLKFTMRMLVR